MTLINRPIKHLIDPGSLTKDEKDERAKQMYAMYSDATNPMSMAEVGKVFELSRERVRQIFNEYGYESRSRSRTRRLKYDIAARSK